MTSLRPLAAAAALVFLAACAVGPDYRRPTTPEPTAFREAWQPAVPADAAPRGDWWTAYGDPTLDELERTARGANQSIVAADAQYRSALAAVGGARAGLFPTIGASVGTTRSGSGASATQAAVGTTPATKTLSGTYTVDRLTGTVSWELDLWGRVRRQIESARSSAQASAADLANAQLSVAATLAQSYVQLRALDMQIALLARTITAYERSLTITRNRYHAGVAALTDVTQAESQLAGAQAQSADLASQRAPLEHAIATLTGRTPEEFTLPPAESLPALPPVPAVLPATLLQRRPDIAAAERRVAAANASVGVAEGAYFPALTLSGSGGYQASAWQHLVSVPNRVWSLGPALAETLVDFGARHAQYEEAKANYDGTVATYRQAVLTGLQDAEDSLAALRELAVEEEAEGRAATAAHETLRATENQYRAGTVSYLNVVIAESTSLSADSTLISVKSRRLLAHIGLLKAMGGSPAP